MILPSIGIFTIIANAMIRTKHRNLFLGRFSLEKKKFFTTRGNGSCPERL